VDRDSGVDAALPARRDQQDAPGHARSPHRTCDTSDCQRFDLAVRSRDGLPLPPRLAHRGLQGAHGDHGPDGFHRRLGPRRPDRERCDTRLHRARSPNLAFSSLGCAPEWAKRSPCRTRWCSAA
jgi:hypothetical protein